jgi:glycerol-3-phosphate dehydrogenase subunit B
VSRRILVLGAGVAGLAAAFAARRKGHAVVVVSAGAGASALGGGAVDDVPWEERLRAARVLGKPVELRALASDVAAFSEALGLWDLPGEGAPPTLLATSAGRLRPARGRDKALLDLAQLSGARVLLPRAPRAGWDADALAATLADDPIARRAGLRFEAIDVPILRFADEARMADADLAARHDDPARITWLAERLRGALAAPRSGHEPVAVLLGSWLGARSARASALSAQLSVPVGEVLVGVGSAAGFRFDDAQSRMLEALGAEHVVDRAARLRWKGDGVAVDFSRGRPSINAQAAVLATGGVGGGGVVYAPPEHAAREDLPPRAAIPYVLSVDAPVTLSLGAGRLGIVASMQGPELDAAAWPIDARPSALEAIGVLAPEGRAAPEITAAGDIVAGRSRTLLEAVVSGLRAGQTA